MELVVVSHEDKLTGRSRTHLLLAHVMRLVVSLQLG